MDKELIINKKLSKQWYTYNQNYTEKTPLAWAQPILEIIKKWQGTCTERLVNMQTLQRITDFLRQNITLKNSNGMIIHYSPFSERVPKAYKYAYMGDVIHFKIEKNNLILTSITRENVNNNDKLTVDCTIDQKIAFYESYFKNNFKL